MSDSERVNGDLGWQ